MPSSKKTNINQNNNKSIDKHYSFNTENYKKTVSNFNKQSDNSRYASKLTEAQKKKLPKHYERRKNLINVDNYSILREDEGKRVLFIPKILFSYDQLDNNDRVIYSVIQDKSIRLDSISLRGTKLKSNVSTEKIARLSGLSVRAVNNSIAKLNDSGLIYLSVDSQGKRAIYSYKEFEEELYAWDYIIKDPLLTKEDNLKRLEQVNKNFKQAPKEVKEKLGSLRDTIAAIYDFYKEREKGNVSKKEFEDGIGILGANFKTNYYVEAIRDLSNSEEDKYGKLIKSYPSFFEKGEYKEEEMVKYGLRKKENEDDENDEEEYEMNEDLIKNDEEENSEEENNLIESDLTYSNIIDTHKGKKTLYSTINNSFWNYGGLSTEEKFVYLAIYCTSIPYKENKKTVRKSYYTIKKLAKMTGIPLGSVKRYIRHLTKRGLITHEGTKKSHFVILKDLMVPPNKNVSK